MLLAADRLDIVEGHSGDALARRLDDAGLHALSGPVKKNPVMVLAGAFAAGVVVQRLLD